MQVTVIGAGGKMGTWFTKYFVRQKHRVFVYDTNKYALKKLKRLKVNLVDELKFTLMNSDIVIVCVPMNYIKRLLLQVSKNLMRDTTLIEISSIKHDVYNTLSNITHMYKLKPLCIHPLFGSGAKSMKDMKVALVPVIDGRAELRNAKNILKGASLITVDVKEHDKIIAVVLGLTHLNNIILAKIMSEERKPNRLKEIAGSTYRVQSLLTEGIMNDDPELFTSLLISNLYMKRYVRNFLETTHQLCNYILNENPRGLSKAYVKIKGKLSQQVNLEKSYETMYKVLKMLK